MELQAAPTAVFPLLDYESNLQGVPTNYTGEWECGEDCDLPQEIILFAGQ